MRFLTVGPRALLVEVDDLAAAMALYAEVGRRRQAGWRPELVDVVPAARTVLLDGLDDPDAAASEVAAWPAAGGAAACGPLVEIPCVYAGDDLAAVADLWEMSEESVVRLHTGRVHRVAFCGFAPGFAYMTGLDPPRPLPRRASPRPSVPAGSVAVADVYTGIYPRSSPGGWHLIGRTDAVVWDPDLDPPALLAPGTRVRFVAVPDRR